MSRAPLGNNTKSVTPPEEGRLSPEMKRRENRAKRYEYQSIARKLLMAEAVKYECRDGYAANYHRTCKCNYIPVGLATIHKGKEHGTAFFGGIAQCGSVWTCPVCAAKIQERRREEIAKGINWAYAQGYKCILVTLTFPHRGWHKLEDLLEQQAKALNKLRAGNPWKRIKEGMGFEGLIRSLELTHGENGWHPHTHELWMVDNDADAEWVKEKTLERWTKACIKAGFLDPSNEEQMKAFAERSVDVVDRVSCSAYLAKQDDTRIWGVDRELAKSSTKVGRKSGRHPFSLLDTATPDNRDGQLFLEYALAMHGKRQIFWSHGLKERVGMKDKTDEDLVEEQREEADILAAMSMDQWRTVIKEDARTEILDIAEVHGYEGLRSWFKKRGQILAKNIDNDKCVNEEKIDQPDKSNERIGARLFIFSSS